MPNRGNSSAIIVARLLNTEGFTSHTAAEIKRYSLKNATEGQKKKFAEIKKEFAELMRGHSKKDRLLVGAYIKILQGMAFDTGLKIGLTACAVEVEEKRKGK